MQFCLLLTCLINFSFSVIAQSVTDVKSVTDCTQNFSTELLSFQDDEDCVIIKLNVHAEAGGAHALSHYTVGVPCGTISDIIVSENWVIENPTEDPTTGIQGFKIDEISGFGDNGESGDFTVEYKVCSSDNVCLDQLKDSIYVAYKAATCVYYEAIYPDKQDVQESESVLEASVYKQDVSCFNGNNGIAGVEITSGTPPYSFTWSEGQTTQEISGLRAGDYTVVVSDSTGDSLTLSVAIVQPALGITIDEEIIDASCNLLDGSISTSVYGGTAPYSYLWSSGDTTASRSQLYAGDYSLTVMDSVGCIKSETYQVEQNTDLSVSLTAGVLECYQEGQGEIESAVQGGVAPYVYLWSSGDTTANLANVESGSYNLTVTDANGCSVTASSYISIKSLYINSSVVNPTCYGSDDGSVGVASVYYGTAPYSYLWSTGDTTSVLTDVASGRYRVTVTDANGCEISRSINIADRQKVSLAYSISQRDCSSNDSIEINLIGSGGMSGYSYYLDGEEISSTYKSDTAGVFTVTVQDALGCETTESINISTSTENLNIVSDVAQPACGGASTGAVNVSVSGGTEPYMYLWSDGVETEDRDELASGTYSVQVTDGNGCYASTDLTIDTPNSVYAEIISTDSLVMCEMDSLIVYASHSGGDTYSWEIIADDLSWYIEESSIDSITYHAGSGTASFVYSVMDDEGCMASDTLQVACSSQNSGEDSGANDQTGDGTDTTESNGQTDDFSFDGSYGAELVNIIPSEEDGCYTITLNIHTDGNAEHELSHLVVGLDDAYVSKASNSENWNMEMNITDPTTGVYGLKIDDISGFGQNGEDMFQITFLACFSDGLPEYLPIAYKAANGYEIQMLYLINSDEEIILTQELATSGADENYLNVSVFPNPFKDKVSIKMLSGTTTDVVIDIYDISGNKVKRIYEGKLQSEDPLTVEYNGEGTTERVLFYKVFTNSEVVEGKLLKVK